MGEHGGEQGLGSAGAGVSVEASKAGLCLGTAWVQPIPLAAPHPREMDSGSSRLHGACVPLALQPLAVAEAEHSLEPMSGCVLGLRAALSPCGAPHPAWCPCGAPRPALSPVVPRILPSPPAVPASCPLPLQYLRPALSPCGARVLPSPPVVPRVLPSPPAVPSVLPGAPAAPSVQWAYFVRGSHPF